MTDMIVRGIDPRGTPSMARGAGPPRTGAKQRSGPSPHLSTDLPDERHLHLPPIRPSHPTRELPPPPVLKAMVAVVPAHNEQGHLSACLASIAVAAQQVLIPVTVIVVLDDCTDHSARFIPPGARTVTICARNVGAARAAGFHAGAQHAGPNTWLACTDADTTVAPRWLSRRRDHHHAGATAVLGTVEVDWQHHHLITQRRYTRRYHQTSPPNHGHGHGHVHGANLGVRAVVHWHVGGFASLPVDEDVDLVDRLLAADIPIVWDDANPVLTSDGPNPRAAGGFGDHLHSLAQHHPKSANPPGTRR